MREFLKLFFQYLAGKTAALISASIFFIVFMVVFSLYSLPSEPVLYGVLLASVLVLVVVLFDFRRFY